MEDGKLKVVYDVDDVLNDLNGHVSKLLNTPNPDNFDISKATNLTDEQKKLVMEAYGNPDTFKTVPYLDDAKKIFDIEKNGKTVVEIHSNNFNQGVADVKRESLKKLFPNVSEDKFHLQVGKWDEKDTRTSPDIIVEDNILNLFKYNIFTVKILIDKPYNQASIYNTRDYKEGIIRVANLAEAIETVEKLVSKSI